MILRAKPWLWGGLCQLLMARRKEERESIGLLVSEVDKDVALAKIAAGVVKALDLSHG